MIEILLVLSGATVGLGVVFVRMGLKGHKILGLTPSISTGPLTRNFVISICVSLSLLLLTGWIGSSVTLAVILFLALGSMTRRGESRGQEQIAESMALWTEQLRDTLAAAHGLQQTLVATAHHAPERIRPQVMDLVAKLPYAPVRQCLTEFAQQVDHSSADFVVAALISANDFEARDVGALLGHLAKCSREESRMHQRIWVGRARTRTAVKIISGTVIGFVAVLFTINREYLEPYGSAQGQIVLSLIGCVFGFALVLLQLGSKVQVPERFIGVQS